MKSIFLSLILIFIAQYSFGQPKKIIPTKSDAPITTELNQITKILLAKPFDKNKLNQYWEKNAITSENPDGVEKEILIDRQLNYDIKQEKIQLKIAKKSYELTLISRNSKVLYCKLFDPRPEKDPIIVEKTDTLEINKIQLLREKEGLKKIDLFSSLNFPYEVYPYGFFCGIAGTPPAKCQEMLDLVNNFNYVSLVKWCASLNPEIAAYGYTGISFLAQQGYQIEMKDFKIMENISKRTVPIRVCEGCSSGVTNTIQEKFPVRSLPTYYKTLQITGRLRKE